MRRLEHFITGAWTPATGTGTPLHDAYSGDIIAETGDTPPMAPVLDYARTTGGPALRAMTPHARALMLKAIGQKLMERKEELYTLSTSTGATRSDSWVDIDGGIGTLLTYASRARRELPNQNVMKDGAPEVLSKDGTFLGQHIRVPREGVAVMINAYNFPVWGMLEKLAPAWIAGMPVLVKPARQTSHLTELCVRMMLDTGLVPEGAVQLICGGAGDLLDHLTAQDMLSFTGSATVARQLRAHPTVIANSVPFNAEADSLNAAILGPDVTPDAPEFDQFVKEVHREMTVKAGQKCTAIRRVIVPAAVLDAVQKALVDRINLTKPDDMGRLVSAAQCADVRAAVDQLEAEANIVTGGAPRGTWHPPTLLRCDTPLTAKAPHEVEAFGPVATLMPYGTGAEAIQIANKGGGSLVASVFTDDPDVAREIGLGIARLNGRIHFGNRASAKSSTGHGSPLPVLIHGGPGRAGGGEELGGMRAVHHHMHRVAIQGTPDQITAVTGVWAPGAATRDDRHPFLKSLAELEVGDTIRTASRVVTLDDIEHFANFTGDTFYAHMDEDAAKRNPFFPGRVAHGYLIVSFAAGLFVEPSEGPVLANYGLDSLRFMAPVSPGDALSVILTAKEITPREGEPHGEVRWDCTVLRDGEAVVAQYDVLTLLAKEPREL
ncbi:phenylacetic acid degradation bifunctional protein PaaZ [Pseudooceanicola onchidii]|uniref:phenylacetic acid degradation bifunctional protein PaaZ n=1 Tax=Pseudooceanicola onchidii TaxID=2562279 RepID=UPI0010A9E03F|nr:phenylacetic acid degradation bifunctional protein PaaZ [Pseudooceanicola onchidii]